jgi:uncharacterized membrane protein YbhN (UPF0104 family)
MNVYHYWTETTSWIVRHKKLLQWVLALLVLVLVGKFLAGNMESLSRLKEFRLWHIVTLFALYSAYLVVSAYPPLIIIRAVADLRIPFWDWYKLFIVSRMGNMLISQAGNIYRAGVLNKRYRLPYTEYVNVYLFFAWINTLANFALVLALILLLKPALVIGGVNGAVAVGVAVIVISAGPLAIEKVLKTVRLRPGMLAKVLEKLHGMFNTMGRQGTNRGLMARVIALGFVQFAIGVFLLDTAFRGMGIQPRLLDLAVFLALYNLSTFVVLTPGNIGIQEMAFGFLSQALGIGIAEGIMASAVLRAVHSIIVFPMGLAFGSRHLFGRKKH